MTCPDSGATYPAYPDSRNTVTMQDCGVSLTPIFISFLFSRLWCFKLRSVLKVCTSIDYLNLKLRSILINIECPLGVQNLFCNWSAKFILQLECKIYFAIGVKKLFCKVDGGIAVAGCPLTHPTKNQSLQCW